MKRELQRAFCLAVNRQDFETARDLILKGADVDGLSEWTGGATLLWLAVNGAGQELSRDFRALGSHLAESLSGVPLRNHEEKRMGYFRTVQMLLAAGANINQRSHGSPPLWLAVHWQDLNMVTLLLSCGADPKVEALSTLSKFARKDGRSKIPGYFNTVLHEAVAKDSGEIVQALLAAGADPNREDHEGRTPALIAQEKGFDKVLRILQSSPNMRLGAAPKD